MVVTVCSFPIFWINVISFIQRSRNLCYCKPKSIQFPYWQLIPHLYKANKQYFSHPILTIDPPFYTKPSISIVYPINIFPQQFNTYNIFDGVDNMFFISLYTLKLSVIPFLPYQIYTCIPCNFQDESNQGSTFQFLDSQQQHLIQLMTLLCRWHNFKIYSQTFFKKTQLKK